MSAHVLGSWLWLPFAQAGPRALLTAWPAMKDLDGRRLAAAEKRNNLLKRHAGKHAGRHVDGISVSAQPCAGSYFAA